MMDKASGLHPANPKDLTISDIKIRLVEHGKDHLLAWASCVLNGSVFLNNIAVRRGQNGNLMLTYPAKRTSAGSRFYFHNPIHAEAAAVIERAIIGTMQKIFTENPADHREGEA